MSAAIEHVFVDVGELRMHAAVAGPATGRRSCSVTGFRRAGTRGGTSCSALADAGYRVIAPDQRGYGRTDAPPEVASYSQVHLVGDLVGLLDALGIGSATVVGHDWGAPVAWHAALLRPDVFPAVVGLSVPFGPRVPGGHATDRRCCDRGSATPSSTSSISRRSGWPRPSSTLTSEARFAASSTRSRVTSRCEDFRFFDPNARCFNDLLREPEALPGWLSEEDLDVFVAEFERKGTFRHGLNWYRNIDQSWELLAPFMNAKVQQPALFIGAERDAIFGLSREGSRRPGSGCRSFGSRSGFPTAGTGSSRKSRRSSTPRCWTSS